MKKTSLSVQDVQRIHEVAQLIKNNLEKELKISDLASFTSLSQKKLKRGFKEIFGMGVHEYIRNVRLEKVKVMLSENKPGKAIVKVTGFKSESGLSKTFKKVVGVTPTEWKNSQDILVQLFSVLYCIVY